MGSLSYVCWAFWLAQVALVCARPEFGTSLQFSFSSDISAAAGAVSTQFAAVDNELHFMLSGLIGNSETQRSLLAGFAEDLGVKGKDVTEALVDAVAATSNVASAFGPVLTAYDALTTFMNDLNEAFIVSVANNFSPLLSEELLDSMSFAFGGLMNFRAAMENLQDAMQNASEPSDVENELLRELLQTLHALNTHLPVVVYVYQRAGLNMQVADIFYATYTVDAGSLGDRFASDLSDYGGDLEDMAGYMSSSFDRVVSSYSASNDMLEAGLVGSVTSSPAFGALVSSLTVFNTDGPALLEALGLADVPAALQGYQDGLEEAVGSVYYDGPEVYAAADVLVEGLIASDVFAEYCFAKYSTLVADVPFLGDLRLQECLDTERPRLHRLGRFVRSFASLLSYDVEDLFVNLETCVLHHTRRDQCLADLTGFYTVLGTEHLFKYGALKDLIEAELVASRTRVAICLAAADYYTFDNLVATLVQDMVSCYEGHDCMESSCETNEEG